MRYRTAILLLTAVYMGTTYTSAQESKIKLTINTDYILTATMVNNSSVAALLDLLRNGPLTVAMSDYGNMEKVGSIGTTLPRNDEQITTSPGDLILYQGSALVIYYAPNSWNFTRLGKIDNVTQQELKNILGEGDVSVTLELTNTAINNEFKEDNGSLLRIYPNPAKDSFRVSGDFRTISLLDWSGRTLLSSNEKQMDISSFPAGTYFLKIITMSSKTTYQKLLKI